MSAASAVRSTRCLAPGTFTSDRVQASGKDGVLGVTIAKQAETMPPRIQVAA